MEKGTSTALLLILLSMMSSARAAVIFQGATPASPDSIASSGVTVSYYQYMGYRFQLTQPALATEIGGRFKVTVEDSESSLFGAIVQLTSATDFPNSATKLSYGTDVLAHARLFPTASYSEISANIGPVNLGPGYYALVFGSGDFDVPYSLGAVTAGGTKTATLNQCYTVNSHWSDTLTGYSRVFLNGELPEPSALALVLCASPLLERRARTSGRSGRGKEYRDSTGNE